MYSSVRCTNRKDDLF